jgi:hypothetical protein
VVVVERGAAAAAARCVICGGKGVLFHSHSHSHHYNAVTTGWLLAATG